MNQNPSPFNPSPNAPAGLTHRASQRFAAADQIQFDFLRSTLRNELLPIGIEEQSQFERHAFCLFMFERAQAFEAIAQEQWMQDPGNPAHSLNLERLQRYRRNYERDADRAYKNLTALQAERILRSETNQTLAAEFNSEDMLPPAANMALLLGPKSRQGSVTALAARVLMEAAHRKQQLRRSLNP